MFSVFPVSISSTGTIASYLFMYVSGFLYIPVIPCRYLKATIRFTLLLFILHTSGKQSLSLSFYTGCSIPPTVLPVLCWTYCMLTISFLYRGTGAKLDTSGAWEHPPSWRFGLGIRASFLLGTVGKGCQTALRGHHGQGWCSVPVLREMPAARAGAVPQLLMAALLLAGVQSRRE